MQKLLTQTGFLVFGIKVKNVCVQVGGDVCYLKKMLKNLEEWSVREG